MTATEKRLWAALDRMKGDEARALRDFMYSATGIYKLVRD